MPVLARSGFPTISLKLSDLPRRYWPRLNRFRLAERQWLVVGGQ